MMQTSSCQTATSPNRDRSSTSSNHPPAPKRSFLCKRSDSMLRRTTLHVLRVLFVRKHPQGRIVVILDPSKVSCLPIASTEIGSPSEGGVIELLHGRDVIIMCGREGACPRLGESIHAPGGGAFSEPSHIPFRLSTR